MEANPFKTSDQGLAAYLLYQGVELIGCIPSGEQGRLFFVFQDAPKRDGHVEEWLTGKGAAEVPKKYFARVKQTRRELKNPMA